MLNFISEQEQAQGNQVIDEHAFAIMQLFWYDECLVAQFYDREARLEQDTCRVKQIIIGSER